MRTVASHVRTVQEEQYTRNSTHGGQYQRRGQQVMKQERPWGVIPLNLVGHWKDSE